MPLTLDQLAPHVATYRSLIASGQSVSAATDVLIVSGLSVEDAVDVSMQTYAVPRPIAAHRDQAAWERGHYQRQCGE